MESVLRDRMSMIAALGAGVVVGISGIYLYYKVNKCVTRELSHLTGTIENLRRDIEQLKAATKSTKEKRLSPERRKNMSALTLSSNRCATGYTSSIDDPDEEYFDFTDTEELVGVWASVNGACNNSPSASDASNWLDDFDNMVETDSSDKESIYCMMISRKEKNADNVEFLWRLAKSAHLYGIVAQNRGELEKKKELDHEASAYSKLAYELDKNHSDVHKWCAITVGSLNEYVGTQERIMNGFIFKEHLDKALILKPLDPTLHYMLGRWCYEVASLSWLERKLATTLFSSPPEATLEEAREHLQEADKLRPNWKENLLYIAKAYIGEGDYMHAISVIDRAHELPVTREDAMAKYFIVEFEDGIQLVPRGWMDKNRSYCSFPQYDPVRYNKAIRNEERANPQWKKFPVKRLMGRADVSRLHIENTTDEEVKEAVRTWLRQAKEKMQKKKI